MGSVLLKEEVAKTIEVGTHGTTFGGGPLACRLSLQTLKIIEQDGLLDQVQEVGAYFRQRLEELTELPVVSEVRGDGLMLAVELTVPAKPIVQQLIDAGFITNATRQTVLRLLPPLILRKKQVDKFLVALRVVLEGAAS
jgi:acetylornithine/succinyldiaminopimelate/putrescine aminotransferase